MDKTIVTAMLIIVGIVMALMLFNAAYPAIQEGGDAIANMAYRTDERMRTQIMIVHASAEINADGLWQDTNANGLFDVFVWVKNVGATRINAIQNQDVFFGPEGNFARIPYLDFAGGSLPYWTYNIEDDDDWDPTGTLRVTIQNNGTLPSGRYFLKIIAPNGVWHEYYLGL